MARLPPPPRVPLGPKRFSVGLSTPFALYGRAPGGTDDPGAGLSRVAFRAGIYAVDRGGFPTSPYRKQFPTITGVPIKQYGVPVGQYDPNPTPPPKPKK